MNAMVGRKTTVEVGGDADLCVEAIGDPARPAILLIGAATWSMDWWEDGLCHRLAEREPGAHARLPRPGLAVGQP